MSTSPTILTSDFEVPASIGIKRGYQATPYDDVISTLAKTVAETGEASKARGIIVADADIPQTKRILQRAARHYGVSLKTRAHQFNEGSGLLFWAVPAIKRPRKTEVTAA